MNFSHARIVRHRLAASGLALTLSLVGFVNAARAQDAEVEGADKDKSEIVVTGTLIRGVAAGGTNVVSVGQADVQATGAATTAQLLQSIPQLGSFGILGFPQGGAVTVNRPNLRSLPGFNTGGGSTTLVLLDGHRVVGMGIGSTTPDPDFIPPGALQRIDVVPDGGSAIYGSDAVAGVMNFITRRDFSGVEASARYGFGDNYHTFDANATVGHKWDGGSIFISYAYAQHDPLFGRDRDYLRTFPSTNSSVDIGNPGVPLVAFPLTCSPGNIILNRRVYALPTRAIDTYNQCDQSDNVTLYPRDHRHSVMAGFNQDLSDSLSVDVRAYYFNRKSTTVTGPFSATKTAGTPANNPQNPSASRTVTTKGFLDNRIGAEASHDVVFRYGDLDANRQEIALKTWGVTTEFTYRPGGDWRVRLMGNYGESTTISHSPGINDTALNRAIGAGRFDPYNWRNSDAVILQALFNYETYGEARQRLFNLRAVADGTLFNLPGGAVKLAFGGEYTQEGYRVMNGAGIPGLIAAGTPALTVDGTLLYNAINPAQRFNLSRDIKALFGEISIPIFGADNATTLFQSLTLSLSGRYDHYSGDVGGTFNPKIGVNWTPIEGLRIRGAWGKAFNAPSLADQRDASLTTVGTIGQFSTAPAQIAFYKPPADLIAAGTIPNYDPKQTILTISGNSPGITPQSGTTLSIGGDIDPPFIPGLRLGITYWQIRLKNQIGQPPFFDGPTFWRYFRGNGVYIVPAAPNADSTDPEILKALALNQSGNAPTLCNQPAPLTNGNCVYAVFDQRKRNLGNTNVSGLDFSVSYRTETSFGGIDASWKGTVELQREEGAGPNAPLIDKTVSNNNLFRFSTVVGADIGNLRAQVTWNFRKGYDLTPAAAIPGGGTQLRVGNFNVFNLFFKYDVEGENMFKDLSFTLNVDNVFDQDPPIFYGSSASLAQSGFANGNTLGRIFTFGVNKRF